ncbi:putative transmembrane protein [Toxoplasma gondii TgCatPRC2]|uniref:Putative transmembrane protein n=1 Tax=Toxoplasma gondii TgCatPRC2 TaxID=1130821 RepID=A0A151GZS8_TOXGO|nr:putative transmembrane protein [Toxoplasma gondii TgCatPRC2]
MSEGECCAGERQRCGEEEAQRESDAFSCREAQLLCSDMHARQEPPRQAAARRWVVDVPSKKTWSSLCSKRNFAHAKNIRASSPEKHFLFVPETPESSKAVLCLVFSRCSLLSAFLCLCFSLLLLFCSACPLSLSLLFLRFPAVSFLSSFCLFRLPSPPCLQDPEGLFSVDELFCVSLAVRERLEKTEDFLPPSLLGIPSVASRELFVHSGRSSLGGGLDVFCHSLLQVLLLRFSLPCFASVR